MHSKYWITTLVSLFAMPLSGQITTQADSQQFAAALAKAVLSTASLPGNKALSPFVVDTLVPGWNPYVAAVIRKERPELLFSLSDSAAAYALRLDLGSASPRDRGMLITVIWSLCNAGYQRETGRLLRYNATWDGVTWSFAKVSMLSGSGDCSYGLNRRAR